MVLFLRSLYKSGAIESKLIPEEGDALIGVGTWVLALFWVGVGATLARRQVLADNYLGAAIIFGPPIVLILVGAFFTWRVLNGSMYGRRH
jgi:hypothetical protein